MNLVAIRGDCKASAAERIGQLKISTTAKYVAHVMLTERVRDVKDICRITGLPRSTVYRAQADLFSAEPDFLTRLTSPTSENPTCLTRPTDGNSCLTGETPSPTDGTNAPRVPARIDPPSGGLSSQQINLQPQPSEQVAAHERGGVQGLEELNGTAVDLVAFIGRHANVQPDTAQRMLRSNVQIYGARPMMDAFATTQAEMTTGLVTAPYKYLIGTAKRLRDEGPATKPSGGYTSYSSLKRTLEEMDAEGVA